MKADELREAKIILPVRLFDDDAFFKQWCKALANEYGGYTMSTSSGTYINDKDELIFEPVHTFTVACTEKGWEALRFVAGGFLVLKGEESVYLVDRQGVVHFLTAEDVIQVVHMAVEAEPDDYDPANCAASG